MKDSKSLLIGDLSFKFTSRTHPGLGLIVSKYYGNAVARNLFKRRCRALFRNKLLNKGISIALIIRPKKQNITFNDVESAFEGLYENICG